MYNQWELEKTKDDDYNPYVLFELDDRQQAIPFTGRQFRSEEEMLHIAEIMNRVGGHNVICYKEIAFCTIRRDR